MLKAPKKDRLSIKQREEKETDIETKIHTNIDKADTQANRRIID